jgi:hypothetical protein
MTSSEIDTTSSTITGPYTTIWFTDRPWDPLPTTSAISTAESTTTESPTTEPQTPTKTTTYQVDPTNTGTVKYFFDMIAIVPKDIEKYELYTDTMVFQKGRSAFADEKNNNIHAGRFVVSNYDKLPWDGTKMIFKPEDRSEDSVPLAGGVRFSIEVNPRTDRWNNVQLKNCRIKILWLNQEWDTSDCPFEDSPEDNEGNGYRVGRFQRVPRHHSWT